MAGSAPPTNTFNCPACDMPVDVRGMGRTPVVACAACGTIIDTADNRLRIIQRFQEEVVKPLIPLGTRGTIKGTEYVVLGYLVKTDKTGMYAWEEYLLLNPYKGFAWLAQAEGHWNFLVSIKDIPLEEGDGLWYRQLKYRKFLSDVPKVASVLGEFYWVVSTGDRSRTEDFIHPPYLLSREYSDGEDVWSFGEYVEPSEVERAFNVSDLPTPVGIAMNQPNPWRERLVKSLVSGVIFATLLVLVHLWLGTRSPKLLFDRPYLFDPSSPPSAKMSVEPFKISGRTTNLQVKVKSDVANDWLSVDFTLMNLDTNEDDDGEAEVAYYTGADSDGVWREGSTITEIYFTGVEPGNYILSGDVSSSINSRPVPYQVSATVDVPTSGNVLLGLLALFTIPVACGLGYAFRENARWGNSDVGGSED